jgi:hypothetical protein
MGVVVINTIVMAVGNNALAAVAIARANEYEK